MSYDRDDYYRRDEYRRQDWIDQARRDDYRRQDQIDWEHRKSDEEAARKQREYEAEMRWKMKDNTDALRVISGLEDDRLWGDIVGHEDDSVGHDTDSRQQELVGENFELSLVDLRFFESDREPPHPSLRSFSSYFKQYSTRYVYFQLDMKNHLYRLDPHVHRIKARYDRPDGEVLCELEHDVTITPDMDDVYYWHGYSVGYGTWPLGTYRVYIFIDGERVAQSQFSIY